MPRWRAYKSLEWFVFIGFSIATFTVLVAVLALIAAGRQARVVVWQPPQASATPAASPVSTEGWQTYRNEKYGFEFRYPTDLVVLDFPNVTKIKGDIELLIGKDGGDEGTAPYLWVTTIHSWDSKDMDFVLHDALLYYAKNHFSLEEESPQPSIEVDVRTDVHGYKFIGGTATFDPSNGRDKFQQYVMVIGDSVNRLAILVDEGNIDLAQQITQTVQFIGSEAAMVDTQSWQTYRNEELGFEFKYPAAWELTPGGGINSAPSVVTVDSPGASPYVSSGVSIYYYPSVADETENKLNHLGATTLQELIDKNIMIRKIGDTTVDGTKAAEVIQGGAGEYYTVFIERDGHLYEIFFADAWDKKDLSEVERQILSTFKFIEPKVTPSL